jgi:hypothetical protein
MGAQTRSGSGQPSLPSRVRTYHPSLERGYPIELKERPCELEVSGASVGFGVGTLASAGRCGAAGAARRRSASGAVSLVMDLRCSLRAVPYRALSRCRATDCRLGLSAFLFQARTTSGIPRTDDGAAWSGSDARRPTQSARHLIHTRDPSTAVRWLLADAVAPGHHFAAGEADVRIPGACIGGVVAGLAGQCGAGPRWLPPFLPPINNTHQETTHHDREPPAQVG